jgi:hypothetical protein
MKLIIRLTVFLLVVSAMGVYLGGCVHDPVIIATDPVDSNGNPVDTNVVDPNSKPCDPNVIYFDNQILPILLSSCALSGCHDPVSKEDGVVLNSFVNVVNTGGIKAFNPGGSKLYKMITNSDLKDRMPPPPMNALTADQKKLITDWILQGAKNETCDLPKTCDTVAVSFIKSVFPIISNNCKVCHSGTAPLGNVSLSSYAEIRNYALSGKLTCVINWNPGCVKMPNGGQKLSDCSIHLIEAWIRQGILNN